MGDRAHAVCVVEEAGEFACEEAIRDTRACLEALSARFPGAVIAMETGLIPRGSRGCFRHAGIACTSRTRASCGPSRSVTPRATGRMRGRGAAGINARVKLTH